MTQDKDARIAELEHVISVMEDSRSTDRRLIERLAEECEFLKRKLAEPQAILTRIRDVYSEGDDLEPAFVEIIKLSGDTELNNILVKAKEEEREACAKVCENLDTYEPEIRQECADAIRAR